MKNNLKFKLASQRKVNSKKLQPYIDKLLEILGHPEALVTDETRISDFIDVDAKKTNKKIKKLLPVDATDSDFLYEIAQKMCSEVEGY